MSWKPEIDEIEQRHALAREMGGAERVARQHARGKLNVRERLDLLCDKGSFREFMALSGTGVYQGEKLETFSPRPMVEGTCRLRGRRVIVSAGDFTVSGGFGRSKGELGQELASNARALEWLVPYVRLLDAAGGGVRSFDEIGRTYVPDGNTWSTIDVQLLNRVPVVSAVMGSVAGLPAINACLAHFNLMVKGSSHLFPGGPPVVKAALGYDVSKEELGGADIHTRQSGVIDNAVDSEAEAFSVIREFLDYLPNNVWEMAPRIAEDTDTSRRDEKLVSLIPRDRRRAYDAHRILDCPAPL